jgi:hypothetical protein
MTGMNIDEIDQRFRLALSPLGVAEHEPPRLLTVAALERLQFFAQFPGQAVFTDAIGRQAPDASAATHVLLPAACYPIYLALADRTLDGPVSASAVARCSRWDGEGETRRLRVFVQRKVVFFGSEASVREQLDRARAALAALAAHLGISASFVPAPPPANVREAARALFAVDDTLVANHGTSTATLAQFNFHRQHYARLCETRTADGGPAFGACIGLLHDAWMTALHGDAGVLAASAIGTSGGSDVSSRHL